MKAESVYFSIAKVFVIIAVMMTAISVHAQEDAEDYAYLKDSVIHDLEDSTILNTIYGNCYIADGIYKYNLGAQPWNENDSTYMQVDERYGDNKTQFIYLHGVIARTAIMHDHDQEVFLVVNKEKRGWRITRIDNHPAIDFVSVGMLGTYHKDFFLERSETHGVYGGGIVDGDVIYRLRGRDGNAQSQLRFIIYNGNGASVHMYSENGDTCNVYAREGEVHCWYNHTCDCIEFDYSFISTRYQCENVYSRSDSTRQVWYMRDDIATFIKGRGIDDDGNITGREYTNADAVISMCSGKKKRKGGFISAGEGVLID